MTSEAGTTSITERGGMLIGPWRSPANLAANEPGSIHKDSVAQKLGFRGGTVAGSIHMEQFPPLLMRTFGNGWWESGSLSCYFRNATMGGEAVRAMVQAPPAVASDAQAPVWMEREDGLQVLEGTASIGIPTEPSMLRRKLAEPREPGELRILAPLRIGEPLEPLVARVTTKETRPRLAAITEPLSWYESASPWGGAILNPGLLVHLMVKLQPRMQIARGGVVGLYGAIEVRHLRGPVFVERDYELTGSVLATGTTPKTEYLWWETFASDAGVPVASMLMMLRFMKASSPLWAGA